MSIFKIHTISTSEQKVVNISNKKYKKKKDFWKLFFKDLLWKSYFFLEIIFKELRFKSDGIKKIRIFSLGIVDFLNIFFKYLRAKNYEYVKNIFYRTPGQELWVFKKNVFQKVFKTFQDNNYRLKKNSVQGLSGQESQLLRKM